jgi:hypothetical protein
MVMRALMFLPLLALGACAQTPADTARAAQATQAAQIGLDKQLSGLTRGETTSCMPITERSAQTQAFGSTILYRVNRGLVYRTDTAGGCEGMSRGDILVTRQPEGRPCRGDIATTVQPVSRVFTGSCSFGDFTVYRRQR